MNQKPGVRLPTGQRAINEDTMKSIGFTTNTKIKIEQLLDRVFRA